MKELANAILAVAKEADEAWVPPQPMSPFINRAAEALVTKDTHMKHLVIILLIAAWNDAIDWAEEVVKSSN